MVKVFISVSFVVVVLFLFLFVIVVCLLVWYHRSHGAANTSLELTL